MKRHQILVLAATVVALALAACAGDTDERGDAGAADGSAMAAADQGEGTMQPGMPAQQRVAPASAADPDLAPGGQQTGLPAGYELRLDRPGSDRAAYHVTQDDGGLHVQTGPAGILYRPGDTVSGGSYTVAATFTEVGAPPNHREAYGLFIGGSDLQAADQRYSYFLVRADGKYLVKQRTGDSTSNVSDGWMDSDAVHAASGGSDLTNRLEVAVRGDRVHFAINGTEVASYPVSAVDTRGIAGVRINHNLNVRVQGFTVTR